MSTKVEELLDFHIFYYFYEETKTFITMKKLLFLSSFLFLWSCSTTQKAINSTPNTTAFSQKEKKMIMEKDASFPMRVYLITNREDSLLLRKKCRPVVANPKDPVQAQFIQRLFRTVRDSMSMGVGIAAPQVGILKNIIWVQRFDKEKFPFEAYLNPKIIQYTKKKQPCPEGCLSIPNRRATTLDRAYAILIEYDTPEGVHKTEMIEDFTAVIFQHEIDHLNGILFIDHLLKEVEAAKTKKRESN